MNQSEYTEMNLLSIYDMMSSHRRRVDLFFKVSVSVILLDDEETHQFF